MAHKQFLHELLKEDQEPFHLKSYISDKKSQMKKPPPATVLQLAKRKPPPTKRSNLCFLPFQNSPDVMRSPFWDLPSPAKSPCKSSTNAVFLHIPSRTAALLVEAAMRVQKPQGKNSGFGLFGTFLKRLKDRSKSKKRAIVTNDIKIPDGNATLVEECCCSNRRLSSADWTENNEDKSLDFEASTSSYGSEDLDCDFGSTETRFCTSPFRFSLHRSPSSPGSRTPDFCSPAASPSRHPKQEKEKYELSRNSDNVQEDEEEEKEQCSPVSVLDPPFEDDGRDSGDADEDDYDHDLECCYENVQRAKQQLMYRLRRFEKLAELDPIELESKLLEGSDEDDHDEREEPLSQYTRLVSDLIFEEKGEMVNSGGNDVVLGRVCKRFDSWKQVEFNTIDMMVGLDLKRELCGWTRFNEQVEETAAEIELEIFVLLVEELSDELSIGVA